MMKNLVLNGIRFIEDGYCDQRQGEMSSSFIRKLFKVAYRICIYSNNLRHVPDHHIHISIVLSHTRII